MRRAVLVLGALLASCGHALPPKATAKTPDAHPASPPASATSTVIATSNGVCRGELSAECIASGRVGTRFTEQEERAALARSEEECAGGRASACAVAAYVLRNGHAVAHDDTRAVALAEKGCRGGDAGACVTLGTALLEGRGTTRDVARARAYFESGCAAQIAAACFNLADVLIVEHGDTARAVSLLDQTCRSGLDQACENLGQAYENGLATAPAERIVDLYRGPCGRGSLVGCHDLGLLYLEGNLVPRDYAKARLLFDRGCTGGLAGSCSTLAMMYDLGYGVTPDPRRVLDLLAKACAGGDALGCKMLAKRKAPRP